MSSSRARNSSLNGWGLSGSGSGTGRLAKGIASRRGARRKKKKSDSDLNFKPFLESEWGEEGWGRKFRFFWTRVYHVINSNLNYFFCTLYFLLRKKIQNAIFTITAKFFVFTIVVVYDMIQKYIIFTKQLLSSSKITNLCSSY